MDQNLLDFSIFGPIIYTINLCYIILCCIFLEIPHSKSTQSFLLKLTGFNITGNKIGEKGFQAFRDWQEKQQKKLGYKVQRETYGIKKIRATC